LKKFINEGWGRIDDNFKRLSVWALYDFLIDYSDSSFFLNKQSVYSILISTAPNLNAVN
jgi:hypothetical protein